MKIISFTWFLSHFSLVSLWPAQSIPDPCPYIQGYPWPYVMLFYLFCSLSRPKPRLILWAFTGYFNDLCSSQFQAHCTPLTESLSSLFTKISSFYLLIRFQEMAPPFPEAPQRCKHTVRLYVIHLWILLYSTSWKWGKYTNHGFQYTVDIPAGIGWINDYTVAKIKPEEMEQ